MAVVAGEDDGLARQASCGVADAALHQVAQNRAAGVAIEDLAVEVLGFVIPAFGVLDLLLVLAPLLVAHLAPSDALAEEFRGQLDHPEGHEIGRRVVDRLLEAVVGGRVAVLAAEEPIGVVVDDAPRRRGQADLEGIK